MFCVERSPICCSLIKQILIEDLLCPFCFRCWKLQLLNYGLVHVVWSMSAKQYSASAYKCILGCSPLCPGSRAVSSWFPLEHLLWMLRFTLPHQLFLCSMAPLFILEAYKQPWKGHEQISYLLDNWWLSRAAAFRATRRTAKVFFGSTSSNGCCTLCRHCLALFCS